MFPKLAKNRQSVPTTTVRVQAPFAYFPALGNNVRVIHHLLILLAEGSVRAANVPTRPVSFPILPNLLVARRRIAGRFWVIPRRTRGNDRFSGRGSMNITRPQKTCHRR